MSIYHAMISDYAKSISLDNKLLIESIFCKANRREIYLFGCNGLSSCLSGLINIKGFVDDYADDLVWEGKPIASLHEVASDAIVVNCVNNARPATALKKIQNAGITTVLSYTDFCKALPDIVPLPEFVNQTRKDFVKNHEKWDLVSNSLSDVESKKVLHDIISFRLTGDLEALQDYAYRPEEQYFEPFLSMKSEIFLDAGGYDGQTTEFFCLRYPDYRKVYLFEPAKNNMALAKVRLKHFNNIEFIEKGVSDIPGILSFNADLGSASAISENGSISIEVATIDSCIKEEVTYIKMDLEGWELKALDGAEGHIRKNHPKLAIAVYHNGADIWRTYEKVISYWPHYRVYLRHYTEGWTETIMYFVPSEYAVK